MQRNSLRRQLKELELARERVSLVQEAEHRQVTERMRWAMYLLGIITGFFMPMSFVIGLLCIKVSGIPGAEYLPALCWSACCSPALSCSNGGRSVGCAGSDVTCQAIGTS